MPKVTCYYDSDIVSTSYAVTGLIELADAGEIELQFRSSDPAVHRPYGHWALWLSVTDRDGEQKAAIDFHDRTDYICLDSLKACRRYFKSNLGPRTYAAVPAEYHDKLRPLGPYFPCRPSSDRRVTSRWLGSAWNNFSRRLIRPEHRPPLLECLREMRRDLQRRGRYGQRLIWSQYESLPQADCRPDAPIIFNPTCWPEEEGDEIRQLNAYRAELIVALRQTFGPRFIGGFRRTGATYHRYPHALEAAPLSHREHFSLFRTTPLAVYTSGKWGCFSWSLAETFAMSKCIVSQTIPNDAGIPLDDRVGILQCDSIEQIVTMLQRLSSCPDEVRELSQRANRYYAERVRPQVRMRTLLAEVLEPNLVAQPTS